MIEGPYRVNANRREEPPFKRSSLSRNARRAWVRLRRLTTGPRVVFQCLRCRYYFRKLTHVSFDHEDPYTASHKCPRCRADLAPERVMIYIAVGRKSYIVPARALYKVAPLGVAVRNVLLV